MRVEYWTYSGVNADGTIGNPPRPEEGSVRTKPELATSGKQWRQTPSTEASGLWMSISTGRLPDGTIHGITLFFSCEEEMRDFEQTRTAELR